MWPNENNACPRPAGSGFTQRQAETLLGDIPALLQQLGVSALSSANPSPLVAPAARFAGVPALRTFLEDYLGQILSPLELPAIAQAVEHVRRGHVRELIALDRKISAEPRLAAWAGASQNAGTTQLRRLKPLRDQRIVRRYLFAVESGQAGGWHTLVYGLTLAVYSFPLRQGLLHYGRETLFGLARAAAQPEILLQPDCQEMVETILALLPAAVEKTIPANEASVEGTVKMARSE